MKAKKVIEKELTNQIKNFTIEETESYLPMISILIIVEFVNYFIDILFDNYF